MTPDELVEKVRNIMRIGCGCDQHCETLTSEECGCRVDALAALRVVRDALREPDEGMRQACRATTAAIITRRHCDEMWQGMLAASPLGRIE